MINTACFENIRTKKFHVMKSCCTILCVLINIIEIHLACPSALSRLHDLQVQPLGLLPPPLILVSYVDARLTILVNVSRYSCPSIFSIISASTSSPKTFNDEFPYRNICAIELKLKKESVAYQHSSYDYFCGLTSISSSGTALVWTGSVSAKSCPHGKGSSIEIKIIVVTYQEPEDQVVAQTPCISIRVQKPKWTGKMIPSDSLRCYWSGRLHAPASRPTLSAYYLSSSAEVSSFLTGIASSRN